MGMREAIIATMILGLPAVAAADAKKPAKAPAKTAAKPAAEKPDPAAPGGDAKAGDADAKADGSAAEPEQQMPPHVVGPKHIELGNSASIDLPAGMIMFERAVAQELLRKAGEPADNIIGIIFKPDSTWHVSLGYGDSGYIDDSDADDLDAKELLASYKQGTEEQNKVRKSLGKPELIIDSWSEAPRYEKAAHHLAWGINAHAVDGKVINFVTRILGRNGFISVTLIDEPERIEASKKDALPVMAATHFNPGAMYADHVSSDRSSGIGLKGLVLGGAGVAVASKLGLLAKLGAILVALKKGIILVFVAIAAAFKKLFRRKKDEPVSQSGGDGSGWPPSGNPPDGMNQG
jgi:uncharacterized membrane-anchored protein